MYPFFPLLLCPQVPSVKPTRLMVSAVCMAHWMTQFDACSKIISVSVSVRCSGMILTTFCTCKRQVGYSYYSEQEIEQLILLRCFCTCCMLICWITCLNPYNMYNTCAFAVGCWSRVNTATSSFLFMGKHFQPTAVFSAHTQSTSLKCLSPSGKGRTSSPSNTLW